MRQAIEEGFILDVLKNYITYKAAYNLALKAKQDDREVDSKKARTKLNQWVILHAHNISQKVKVIVEHFKTNVKDCLHGQAKAMIVTSSRKTAVRYKLALDKYVKEQGYSDIVTMVAFSGEVQDNDISYTESNMNPYLKGRDMREAFDSEDYQLMLVANKFQTGFDQPKLCAMYVDKKLGGVECVQTLSRLNRDYPGKKETGTFVLDFYNNPEDILAAFLPYYKTAELADVSDPDLVYDLFDKLKAQEIYQWTEVEQFYKAFLTPSKSAAAISNICKPAVERWQNRYRKANTHFKKTKEMFERTRKSSTDTVLITNAEIEMKNSKIEFDSLLMFKKDLGSFTRFYEFMSQIIDYEKKELDELSLFARHLRPLLREEEEDEDDIDLGSVILTHYRLSKIREENLVLDKKGDYRIEPSSELGTGKAKNKEELFLSAIIDKLNELFDIDELTPKDMINYAYALRDKILENKKVMAQIKNNPRKQILLGDYPAAVCDAVMESGAAHNNQMQQCLSDNKVLKGLELILLDMIQHNYQHEIR